MNESNYRDYLEECYVYIIIRINSSGNGTKVKIEGIYRDKKIANKLLWALKEEAKGALEVSFQLTRALF